MGVDRIEVQLSKDEFAYDVRSLIQAFYPKSKLCFTEMDSNSLKEEEKANCKIQVNYLPDGIMISYFENGKLIIKKEEAIPCLLQKTGIMMNSFESKANLVIKKDYKNVLKRLLYHTLSKVTNKELPWGTLTGIRPIKIPMKKLEEGIQPLAIEQYLMDEYLCSNDKANLSVNIARREYDILNEIDYKNGYSIYIGIPFCPSTCLYCSFTSYSIEKYKDYVEDYLEALFKEIDFVSKNVHGKTLTTIYLGGGTPTTLSAKQLKRLLTKIRVSFPCEQVKELTVEAGRPDSITREKLEVLKELGVTRISINPQSMNQKTLDVIGRRHSVEQIVEAFRLARETGHDNINMDLILGLPGESCLEVKHTLEEINKLKPDSITIHTLAIKRAARLNTFKEQYKNMAPTDTIEMLTLSKEYAMSAGYEPYYLYRQKNMTDNLENIGYSMKTKEGIYNILIMEEKHTIIALGAGSASKFVFKKGEVIERSENVKSVKDYIERVDEMIDRKRELLERNFS